MSKKKAKVRSNVVTIQDLAKALDKAIGFSDHATENEGREFTFVIADELFDVMGSPKTVDMSQLPRGKALTDALQAALVPDWLNTSNHCTIHEILEASDDSEGCVWVSVKVRIMGVLVTKDYRGLSFYRDTGRKLTPAKAESKE